MTDYLIDGEILGDIASAIREKTNSTDTITPENMASEIASITVGNKITDLTDTTWYIPSGWIASAGYGSFEVDFNITAHGGAIQNLAMKKLYLGYTLVSPTAVEGGEFLDLQPHDNNMIVSPNTGFVLGREIYNGYALTITFTGGNAVSDTNLINWLYTYGELQVEEPEIDLSAYQTRIDESLKTKSKQIAGAINELNAKIGTSTPSVSLIGTWTVIDEPEIPTTEMLLSFTSNGETFNSIGFSYTGSSSWNIRTLTYGRANGDYVGVYTDNPSGNYGIPHGWSDEAYKTITVTEEPTDPNAIAWLGANTDAPKIDTPSKPCFEMPQIRFANATYTNGTKMVDADNPLTLSVEIVGGGTLQEGDKLQICVRRTYGYKRNDMPYRKQKLRAVCTYDITNEDIDKRFISISTNDLVNSWLFRNDRNSTINGEIDTQSAFYLRIKRVTKYNGDGVECDAIFSNIVTVWKTYNPNTNEVNIK